MAIFDVKDFGALGNGQHDDYDAFTHALDVLDSFIPPRLNGGGILWIPTGEYLLTRPLVVKHGSILQGAGSQAAALLFVGSGLTPHETISGVIFDNTGPGVDAGDGSIRDLTVWTDKSFPPQVDKPNEPPFVEDDDPFYGFDAIHGLDIIDVSVGEHWFKVAGDQLSLFFAGTAIFVSGSVGNDETYTVSASELDGTNTKVVVAESVSAGMASGKIFFWSRPSVSKNGLVLASGIVVRSGVSIQNCNVLGFQHDGIHINSPSLSGPYNWEVRNCTITGNGRHGIFVRGFSGCAVRVECINNRKYGFYNADHSNTYVGCVSQSNGITEGNEKIAADGPATKLSRRMGGQYWIGGGGGYSVLLGCMDDGGESVVTANNLVLGGRISRLSFGPKLIEGMPVFSYEEGDISARGVRSSGVRHIKSSAEAALRLLKRTDTTIIAEPFGGMLNLTLPHTVPEPGFKDSPDLARHLLGYQVTIKKFVVPGKVSLPGDDVYIQPSDVAETIDGIAGGVTLTENNSWVTILWALEDPQESTTIGNWFIIGRG